MGRAHGLDKNTPNIAESEIREPRNHQPIDFRRSPHQPQPMAGTPRPGTPRARYIDFVGGIGVLNSAIAIRRW